MLKQKKEAIERESGGRERALWISVIQQAIEDYNHDPLTSKHADVQQTIRRLADKAKYWLFQSKLETIGSLTWICNEIDVPIENIRKKARESHRKQKITNSFRESADYYDGRYWYPSPPEGLPVGLREFDTF